MSQARPITNVTEYVCGACWNGFAATDLGVQAQDGAVICPHCGHLQPDVAALAEAVRAAPATDDDGEFAVAVERAPEQRPVPSPPPAEEREELSVASVEDTPVALTAPPAWDEAPQAAAAAAASAAGPSPAEVAASAAAAVGPPRGAALTTEELLASLEDDPGADIFSAVAEAVAPATAAAIPPTAPSAIPSTAERAPEDSDPEVDVALAEDTAEFEVPADLERVDVLADTGRYAKPPAAREVAVVVTRTTAPTPLSTTAETDRQVAAPLSDLDPEPTEWKLRAPPGLTYNFHSIDALLGWASSRAVDALQVSIDGKLWRPVGPFLQALRAGHKGRKAFALAQVPEVVATIQAQDSRTALDDIRDVDVRHEVLRTLEQHAAAHSAATIAAPALELPGSPTRTASAAMPAASALGELATPAGDAGAGGRAASPEAGEMPGVRSLPVGVERPLAPMSQPSATTRRATGLGMEPAPAGGLAPPGDRPALDAGTRRTSRMAPGLGATTRPSERERPTTQHTPIARKQDAGGGRAGKVVAVILVAALAAVVVLHMTGIWRVALP